MTILDFKKEDDDMNKKIRVLLCYFDVVTTALARSIEKTRKAMNKDSESKEIS